MEVLWQTAWISIPLEFLFFFFALRQFPGRLSGSKARIHARFRGPVCRQDSHRI